MGERAEFWLAFIFATTAVVSVGMLALGISAGQLSRS